MSPRKSGALSGPFNWPAAAASRAPPAIGTVPRASPARPDIRPSPLSPHRHRTHQTTTLTGASTTVTSMGAATTSHSRSLAGGPLLVDIARAKQDQCANDQLD